MPIATWEEPFAIGSTEYRHFDPGVSLLEICREMASSGMIPKDFESWGIITIGGVRYSRESWPFVRPKGLYNGSPVIVQFHAPIQGGQGSTGKQVIGLVAAIALTFATQGIAAGALQPVLGAAFAAKTAASYLAAAALSITGALLIGALVAPPTRRTTEDVESGTEKDSASIDGNILQANTSIPRVIGTMRVYPPFLIEPYVELVGQDEVAYALCGLAGPHQFSDFRLGDTSVDVPPTVVTDVQLEYREGLPGDAPLQLNTRQARTLSYNTEMSVHQADPNSPGQLDPNVPNPLPVWHGIGSRMTPHEIWIHLQLRGLMRNSNATQVLRIPFRMRGRLRGTSTWRYFPEFHWAGNLQALRRLQIKILFVAGPTSNLPTMPSSNGFVEIRKAVPGQNVQPIGSGYTADSYFSSGAGNDSYRPGTESTTNVRNATGGNDIITFFLDRASWPAGIYDFELIRGNCLVNADYTPASYEYSGNILDFFGRRDSGALPMSRDGLVDTVAIVRSVSIWNEYPVNQRNLAVISITAKNRSVAQLSVLASGLVRDWDGSGWNNLIATSNPAPHFVEVLSGTLNLDPLPADLRDDATLVEWRQACIDNDYTCDMVVEGLATDNLLDIIASCGYARPYKSEIRGVIMDYDRSAEEPIQYITPRNARGFSWRKGFAKKPAGFRVNWLDILQDYQSAQTTVNRPGTDGSSARFEQVTYEGFVHEEKVLKKAIFDLRQIDKRMAFYSCTMPVSWIRCRRGSLVGVNYDIIQRFAGSARIKDLTLNISDEITHIILDSPVNVYNEPDMFDITDMFNVPDMFLVGAQSGVGIQCTDGSEVVTSIANSTGWTNTLELTTPIPWDDWSGGPFDQANIGLIDKGCIVVVGQIGQVYKRQIVLDITPSDNLTANLTLVDEAPELWAPIE